MVHEVSDVRGREVSALLHEGIQGQLDSSSLHLLVQKRVICAVRVASLQVVAVHGVVSFGVLSCR